MPDATSSALPTPTHYQRTTGGGLAWQPPTPEQLQEMLPAYEVMSVLGRGGMGAVYKGRQKSLDRIVAIKILPREAAEDDMQFAERFKNEARTMAKMNHPAIVHVYDFGETSEGQLYIVMEFIDGTDVAQMIQSQGKLPEDYALSITAHVCDALGYAHAQGVVHRDIKPANVMVNMSGQIKVADFGLAKATDPSQMGLTKTNMAMGTPDFVSPEALMPGVPLDGRADLYAVGVMLYNMLTGSIPRGAFRMPSATLKTDARFDAIILKSMEMDRENRYQTALDLRRDLDVILTTPAAKSGAQTIPAQQAAPAQKPMGKSPGKPQQRPAAAGAAPAAGKAVAKAPVLPAKKASPAMIYGIATAVVVIAGGAFMFSGGGKKPASTAKAVAVTKPESQPLTPAPAPKPAASTPAPAPVALATGKEPWVDGLAQWFGGTKTHEKFVRESHGSARVGDGVNYLLPVPPSMPGFRDQVARVRARFSLDGAKSDVQLYLRRTGANAERRDYVLHPRIWVNAVVLGYNDASAGKANASLESFPLPANFDPAAVHTLEFRAVGDLLAAFLDGKKLGEKRDTRFAVGHPTLSARGVVIESFEYANLDPAGATPTPVAAAPAKPGEVLTFGGHRYQMVRENMTWGEAKAKAETMGGHLAAITSKAENDWILKNVLIPQGTEGHFHIGGSRDPKNKGAAWKWVTGEAVDMGLWTGRGLDGTGPALTLSGNGGSRASSWDDVGDTPKYKYFFLVEWDDDGTAKPPTVASSPPASTTNTAAATNTPAFENSLGMKFVPVPITGGPTSGQRVLFSIWETRVQDYQAFADETQREWPKAGSAQGATHPAVNVLWEDAQAFCTWLTKRERKAGKLGAADSYRLPSDHEWSCAVGIGEQEDTAEVPDAKSRKLLGVFPWGSTWPPPAGAGNYAGEEMQGAVAAGKYPKVKEVIAGYHDDFVDKSPVGSFAPNRLGLYDMSGNVGEWFEDWINEAQDFHGFRGASFATAQRELLVSSKRVGSGTRYEDVGFRVVLSPATGSLVGAVVTSTSKSEAVPTPEPAPTMAPPPPVAPADPRLAQLAAGFKARFDADAGGPFNTALAALNQSYVANGIARARAAAKEKGALEEVTALDAEKENIEKGSWVSGADAAEMPDSLKTLRTTYRTAQAKLMAERNARAAPIYDLYVKALDAYITELTKADKIEQAQQVKLLRENIAAEAEEAAHSPAQRENAQPRASASLPPPLEVKGSSWRAAAAWCLQSKGIVWNKGFEPVFKVEDLPPGRFEVNRLNFDDKAPAGAVTDATLVHLNGLRELNKFEAHMTEVAGPGLEVFRTTPKVDDLILRNAVQLKDEHLAPLGALKELKQLTIEGGKFTGAGLRLLLGCKKLQKLDIVGMSLTAEEAGTLHTLFPALTSLHLGPGSLTEEMLKVVGRFAWLETLDLSDNPELTDTMLAPLSGLTGLRSLKISNCGKFRGTGLASFSGSGGLCRIEIILGASHVSGTALPVIASSFPLLEELILQLREAKEEDFKSFGTHRSLKYLKFYASAVPDDALASIATLPKLQTFDLAGDIHTAAGLEHLLQSKSLTTLILAGGKNMDTSVVPLLKQFKKLKTLDIKNVAAKAAADEIKKALPDCNVSAG